VHGRSGSTVRRMVLLAILALAASWSFGSLPAHAASGDSDVVPSIDCSFLDTGTGMYNTVWGYKNQTQGPKFDLSIPIGAANSFDNPRANAGQPTVFKPGTAQNAFIVTHKGSSTWTLTGYRVTAPGKACATNPVPIADAGWSSLATIAVFTVVVGAVVFWRARRARRA
jgi:hypothetical protein